MCTFIVLGLVFHTRPRDWLGECLQNHDVFCVGLDVDHNSIGQLMYVSNKVCSTECTVLEAVPWTMLWHVQVCVRTWQAHTTACVEVTRRALDVNWETSVTLLHASTAHAVLMASPDLSVNVRQDTQVDQHTPDWLASLSDCCCKHCTWDLKMCLLFRLCRNWLQLGKFWHTRFYVSQVLRACKFNFY